MSHDNLRQFAGEKYLNLETYRKSGIPVATPMWFAEKNGTFYVYSLANAGKVKRIRNNPLIRITPCNARGKPHGNWVSGKARLLSDERAEFGQRLLTEKYGWVKRVGDLYSKLLGRERVVIAIELAEESK